MDDKIDHSFEDILLGIAQLDRAEQLSIALSRIQNAYGLQSVAYLGVDTTPNSKSAPYLAVTYSLDWIDRYRTQNFMEIDPAIQVGMRRMLPFDWSSFPRTDSRVRNFFGESIDFGVGRQGLSIAVRGPRGDRALFSITSNARDSDWQSQRLHLMRDFYLLSVHFHQAVTRLQGISAKSPRLSPRERECLLWIAEGKTAWETGQILGLSEHTVRSYLTSARHKLGAVNNVQAIDKAGKANLLIDLP